MEEDASISRAVRASSAAVATGSEQRMPAQTRACGPAPVKAAGFRRVVGGERAAVGDAGDRALEVGQAQRRAGEVAGRIVRHDDRQPAQVQVEGVEDRRVAERRRAGDATERREGVLGETAVLLGAGQRREPHEVLGEDAVGVRDRVVMGGLRANDERVGVLGRHGEDAGVGDEDSRASTRARQARARSR